MRTRTVRGALLALLPSGVALAQSADSAPIPATWTVFGMDSTSGLMIGIVLMLVFILAIVAVSRNERTTSA